MGRIFQALIKILIGFGLLGMISAYAGLQYIKTWAATSIPAPASETYIELQPGLPLAKLADQLENKKLISNRYYFMLWVKMSRNYSKFQAGTYLFNQEVSPTQIRDKIISGDTFVPLVLQVAIPEGFTLKMLVNRLATKNVGKLSALQELVSNRKFIRSLGVNSASLEGYTYPATYNFDKMPTAEEFFRKVVKTFFENLPSGYEEESSKMGFTLNEAVTFASLIELETMREEEKPLIAEVIHSRLKKGQALGIDAAIIYGIQNYDGDLKWKDLKNANNPYNTRVHRGLPPTPIGAVSKSSLLAVLNPSNLGYYYYVLDGEDRTRHVFSKTLTEHNAQVRKFLRSQEQTEIHQLKKTQQD